MSPCYQNGGTVVGKPGPFNFENIHTYSNTSWIPGLGTTYYGQASSLEDFADSFASTIMNSGWVSPDRTNTVTALIQMYSEPYPH